MKCRKRTCNFLLVINYGRISYGFRDVDALSFKIACFPHPTLVGLEGPQKMQDRQGKRQD